MSRYCLDTSAYSWFKRGHDRVVRLVDEADWIGVPTIVLGELFVGFLAGRKVERNLDELEAFLGNPVVEQIPVDGEVARIYAEIVLSLRAKGTPIPSNDIWVAASAGRSGATLLAADAHFAAVDRIGVLLLEAG